MNKIEIDVIVFKYVLVFRFKIDDLVVEKKYLLNVKLSICFETSGDCQYVFNVFEDSKVPKLGCNWGDNFPIKGK